MKKQLDRDSIYNCIHRTLLLKFEQKLTQDISKNNNLRLSFENHNKQLAQYIYDSFLVDNNLSTDFVTWLHTLLYPKDFIIHTYDYNWIYHKNLPGKWRKHNFPENLAISKWTKQINIENDLVSYLNDYSTIEDKKRIDILKFYIDFLRVHPFSDSNNTIISIICDIECEKYWLESLRMLNIRFWDIQFLYYIIYLYESNKSKETLELILNHIDNYHKNNLSQQIIEEKNKQPTHYKNEFSKIDPFQLVLHRARESGELGGLPIGAVMTIGDEIVGSSYNEVALKKYRRNHAEVLLINELYDRAWYDNKKIFVTFEPCKKCFNALRNYGIDEIHYIVPDIFWWWAINNEFGIKVIGHPELEKEYIDIIFRSFSSNPHLINGKHYRYFASIYKKYYTPTTEFEIDEILIENLSYYLSPRVQDIDINTKKNIIYSFLVHTGKIQQYVIWEYINWWELSTDFVMWLHRLLYPEWNIIKTTGIDWVSYNIPAWEFRKHNMWERITKFSSVENVRLDLTKIIDKIVNNKNLSRQDILKFYFEFLCIHPFGEGNWRTACILADIIAYKNKIKPLNLMDIKKQNPNFDLHIIKTLNDNNYALGEQLIDDYFADKLVIADNIYDINIDSFLDYIENSDAKDILSNKLIEKITNMNKDNIIITDVWAGSWYIAQIILEKLWSQYNISYHYIEPSYRLIEHFKQSINYNKYKKNLYIYEDWLEWVHIQKSDLIIASQSLHNVDSLVDSVSHIYENLKAWWIACIVVSSEKSTDFLIKDELGIRYWDVKPYLITALNDLHIPYSQEEVISSIDVSGIIKNNRIWKNLLSFYYGKSIEELTSYELSKAQDVFMKYSLNWKLQKTEDYIWIVK